MTTDWKALCAELVAWAEKTSSHYYKQADVLLRARAALAEQEVMPTDEELLHVAAISIEPYESSGIATGEYEPETECAVEVYGSELIAYARATLARWGNPAPQPVAVAPYREVADLVVWLEDHSAECLELDQPEWSQSIAQAARFLHLYLKATPQPVAISERLPGPEDCDVEGRCWLWERDCGYSGRKWALVDRTWSLSQSDEDLSVYTHWLPFHALPLPKQEVSE